MNLRLCLLFCFLQVNLMAQIGQLPKCYIEEEEVIFEFDINAWKEGINDKNSLYYDFRDFDIENVIASGQLYVWNKNGWVLVQLNNYQFQLRKKLDAFKGNIPTNIKYMINDDLWTSPHSEPIIKEETPIRLYANEKKFEVSNKGNTTFFIKGNENAKKVILCGTFNKWNEEELKMVKTKDGWEMKLNLVPGIYEYKFIVDGKWTHDTSNPLFLTNEHLTLNSILLKGKEVNFFIEGHTKAKSVVLCGSFNNWNESAMKMKKSASGWSITVSLPPGKHFYKFLIDHNDWIIDPNNNLQQRDRNGILNSVVLIH